MVSLFGHGAFALLGLIVEFDAFSRPWGGSECDEKHYSATHSRLQIMTRDGMWRSGVGGVVRAEADTDRWAGSGTGRGVDGDSIGWVGRRLGSLQDWGLVGCCVLERCGRHGYRMGGDDSGQNWAR